MDIYNLKCSIFVNTALPNEQNKILTCQYIFYRSPKTNSSPDTPYGKYVHMEQTLEMCRSNAGYNREFATPLVKPSESDTSSAARTMLCNTQQTWNRTREIISCLRRKEPSPVDAAAVRVSDDEYIS